MRRSATGDWPPPPYTGPRAISARVARDQLIVGLRDGRTLSVPLQLIPGFDAIPRRALSVCEVGKAGIDIYFPALDEFVGVDNLLHPERTVIPVVLPRVVNPQAIPARRTREGSERPRIPENPQAFSKSSRRRTIER